MNSNLITGVVPTKKYSSRNGHKITKITPHHMAGVMSATQCAKYHRDCDRDVSANYYIGNDGSIVMGVPEQYRSWCSSSRWNDEQAITIEVSNCENGGDWKVSDAAFESLIKLCTDICKRYNFKLNYTGNKYGNLTRHNMFANTNCPGPYLQGKFNELASRVNKNLGGFSPYQIAVDGHIGPDAVKNWQKVMGVGQDGVISGQSWYNKRRHVRINAIRYGWGGSNLIRSVQKMVGANQDGHLGYDTITKWQKYIGTNQDGYFGPATAKATQRWINARLREG